VVTTVDSSFRRALWSSLLTACTAWACSPSNAPAGRAEWISDDPDEQRIQLERQLRGFDLAMLETGHRYVDLYWAGHDGNWEAAAYMLQKMRLAIENGLERRPKRAESAQPFLAGPLAALDGAVAARDPVLFTTRFAELTAGCNACHAAERVAFFEIRPPDVRVSPIHGPRRGAS
jgi:hypothetical protein